MKLSLFDLMVIEDTLIGSLSVNEGGRIWKYPNEVRQEVRDRLATQATNVEVTTESGTEERK